MHRRIPQKDLMRIVRTGNDSFNEINCYFDDRKRQTRKRIMFIFILISFKDFDFHLVQFNQI